MITGMVLLYIREKENDLFEVSFQEAQKIISKMKGCQGHESLLHHFYDPFPVVEHYQKIY